MLIIAIIKARCTCECGTNQSYKGGNSKTFGTAVGPLTLKRASYPVVCGKGVYPLEEVLGLTELRGTARDGSEEPGIETGQFRCDDGSSEGGMQWLGEGQRMRELGISQFAGRAQGWCMRQGSAGRLRPDPEKFRL